MLNLTEKKPKKQNRSSYINFRQNRLPSKERHQGEKGHCKIIKGSFSQQVIIILNVYTPNS